MYIKQHKPNKKGRYQQGYINPSSCKKLFKSQSNEPIIFRSSYERIFVHWLESNNNVKQWASECLEIPYMFIDGKMHRYYPDYVVEMINGDKLVVEIKPKNQTIKPLNENSTAYEMYVKNMCKWKAAKKFCDDRGYKFQIITEDTISRLK